MGEGREGGGEGRYIFYESWERDSYSAKSSIVQTFLPPDALIISHTVGMSDNRVGLWQCKVDDRGDCTQGFFHILLYEIDITEILVS